MARKGPLNLSGSDGESGAELADVNTLSQRLGLGAWVQYGCKQATGVCR